MRSPAIFLLTAICLSALHGAPPPFSGEHAFEYTRKAVAFGPRPPGSAAIKQLQAYILAQIASHGGTVSTDDFNATTPKGSVPMRNIIARYPGKSGKVIVISGHYDTKILPGFVGANDGGSSTGFLLAMLESLQGAPRKDDIWVVFLDGEEAFGEWSDTDSLYGSRHLAQKWLSDGTSVKVKALINVDMIGDKHLNIKQEQNSNARLRQLVWRSAADLGYQAYFVNETITIEDDHMEFIKRGIPSLDLIDFDYPPWHTDEDTMDKLSPQSLEIVGTVVLDVIQRLERQ